MQILKPMTVINWLVIFWGNNYLCSIWIKKRDDCVNVKYDPFSDRKNLNTSQGTKIHLLSWKECTKISENAKFGGEIL